MNKKIHPRTDNVMQLCKSYIRPQVYCNENAEPFQKI